MLKGAVFEVFGISLIFLIEKARFSELYVYTEQKPSRNMVGIVNIYDQLDLSKTSCTCWRLCHRNTQCTSYFENSVSGKCYLSRSNLSEEQLEAEYGWKYYVKSVKQIVEEANCPADLGYTYDQGTKLCIKMLTLGKMYRTYAVGNCTEDGGRLLQIRKEKQQEALVKYMETFYPNYSPLIDGSWLYNDGVWTFEDGRPLTYFKWYEGEPVSNKNCIRISSNHNFEWRSAYCSVKNHFICEIPPE